MLKNLFASIFRLPIQPKYHQQGGISSAKKVTERSGLFVHTFIFVFDIYFVRIVRFLCWCFFKVVSYNELAVSKV
jgi:hypothetical protein